MDEAIDFLKLNQLFKRARRLMEKRGYQEESDDFCEYVFQAFLRNRRGTLNQLYIDYLRIRHGDQKGQRKPRARFQPLFSGYEPMGEPTQERAFTFQGAEGVNRAYLMLYYEWGFTLKEMGKLFNVSEAEMSLRLKEARNELARLDKKEERD